MVKLIKDSEFLGWQFMNTSESGFLIYQDPTNMKAAMVDSDTKEVIFIMDIKSGEALYASPDAGRYARDTSQRWRLQFENLYPRRY